jgi:hypothetical protein
MFKQLLHKSDDGKRSNDDEPNDNEEAAVEEKNPAAASEESAPAKHEEPVEPERVTSLQFGVTKEENEHGM